MRQQTNNVSSSNIDLPVLLAEHKSNNNGTFFNKNNLKIYTLQDDINMGTATSVTVSHRQLKMLKSRPYTSLYALKRIKPDLVTKLSLKWIKARPSHKMIYCMS